MNRLELREELGQRGLCQCGCGEKAPLASMTNKKHGHRQGEPMKYILGHQARVYWGTNPEEFVEDPETHCWMWQRALRDRGHGQLNRGGKVHKAHRYYYEDLIGAIPEGKQLHHLCMNPACVNPGHLALVECGEHTRLHAALRRSQKPPIPLKKCECGCGEEIPSIGKAGVPVKFKWGHNARKRVPA